MAWRPGHRSWEGWSEREEFDAAPDWDDSEDIDYKDVRPETAGEELFQMLADLKVANIISAKQACMVVFGASRAGACGPVGQLGLCPDAGSGKFAARFDKVVGTRAGAKGMYMLPLARRIRHDASRRWDEIPVVPPHEALAREAASDPRLGTNLRQALAENRLPPAYCEHPAVKAADEHEPIHPVCLYCDGVGYHRQNSALGVWI